MATDCEARCVDGADLGVAEHAATIANADPRCPVHGDPDAVVRYIAALERVAQAARGAEADPDTRMWTALRTPLQAALAELDKED